MNLPTGWAPESFPSLATHSRTGEGSFRSGAPRPSNTVLATHLPCSIQPFNPQDGALFLMAVQSKFDTVVLFPADPACLPNDKLTDEKTGRVYQVRGQVNQADEDLLWAVACQSVDALA